MSSSRLRALAEQVNALAKDYGEQASSLSAQIVAFESLLSALEGKIEVKVNDNNFTLRFKRRDRDNWGLIILYPNGVEAPLVDASVSVKVRAVGLFEPLLTEMLKAHQDRQASLVDAVKTLGEILGTEREE